MRSPAPDPYLPAVDEPKSAWRRWARSKRLSLDPIETGRAIAGRLEKEPIYAAARHVLVYLAFAGEPDLAPLIGGADKTFYATRTEESSRVGESIPQGRPLLTLHRLDPDELERHRFGFLQPSPLAAPVAPGLIDLVLVPGLAFDRSGHRLGFGMGYYDRLLATLGAEVPRVGITPAQLLVTALPNDEHDVPMTHIATEAGLLPVGRSA